MSRRCDIDSFSGLCHDGPARRHRQGPTVRVVAGLVAPHGETKPVGSSSYGDPSNRRFLAFSKLLLFIGPKVWLVAGEASAQFDDRFT